MEQTFVIEYKRYDDYAILLERLSNEKLKSLFLLVVI